MERADPLVVILHEWFEVFMQRSIRHFLTFARENGLSMSQIGALFQIQCRGSSGVGDLGDNLGVTSSAASQLLERLVQQGLIVRSEDPSDRRAKQIALTDRGRWVLQGSIRAPQSWLSDLSDSLSDGDRQAVITALRLLIDTARGLSRPIQSQPPSIPGEAKCEE